MKFKVICALLIVVWGSGMATPLPAMEKRASTAKEQTALELTVYNQDLGLVKDQRRLTPVQGRQELQFMDVAARIIPPSVSIRSLGDRGLRVLEQNYEYDLISPRKLMDKYVGRKVKLITRNPYTDREEVVSATVLANNEGVPVYQIGRDITYGHPGRVLFPEIPRDLIAQPTLVWLLEVPEASPLDVEVRYLTNGINWRADYVLVLNERDTLADLSGWVTIENRSGATYPEARLKLVAGDVHRVLEEDRRERKAKTPIAMAREAAPPFKEDSFFEYHLYTLERKTTLKDQQTKQISLLEGRNIPIKKEFVYRGFQHYFRNKIGEIITNQKVSVFVEFRNKKENNLGIPIPKGILRVYKQDTDRSLQLVGEDRVDHTAPDEKIRVKMGEAFDLAASRRQTSWEKLGGDTYESGYEITLRNHKKEEVTVKVIEPLPGDWRILESSLPFTKMDAATVSFAVSVAPEREAKLQYKVRIRF